MKKEQKILLIISVLCALMVLAVGVAMIFSGREEPSAPTVTTGATTTASDTTEEATETETVDTTEIEVEDTKITENEETVKPTGDKEETTKPTQTQGEETQSTEGTEVTRPIETEAEETQPEETEESTLTQGTTEETQPAEETREETEPEETTVETSKPTEGTEEETAPTETEGSQPTEGTVEETQETQEEVTRPAEEEEEEQVTQPTELPPNVEITPETDPDTGKTQEITFPCKVEEYNLTLEKLAPYDGAFVEDGTNVNVEQVAMLMVKNDGDRPIEYTSICVEYGDEQLIFDISALPVGERLVVQEKTCKRIPEGPVTKTTALIIQRSEMEMSQDKIRVTDNGNNSLTVENLTQETYPTTRVFYKYYMKNEGLFVGGIAFTVRIRNLGPGEKVTVQPAHYNSTTGRVVMVQTYDN